MSDTNLTTSNKKYVPQSRTKEAWQMFRRNKAAMLGLVILTIILLVTIYAILFVSGDPYEIVWRPFTAPGEDSRFPLGTDYLGRDILIELVKGGGATLMVGGMAAIITVIIGVLFGALAGFFGGSVDNFLMRITEFFQVLPALLFSIIIVSVFSSSLIVIAFAIGIISWPQTARLARAEFLKIKSMEYVTAARAIGSKDNRIIWRVILPNALPPLIVASTFSIGTAILFEAGLSFLGLSDPNRMSWGFMIGSNREYILEAWWPVTLPGIAIFLTVLSVSLIGDGLNDAFNPKLRER